MEVLGSVPEITLIVTDRLAIGTAIVATVDVDPRKTEAEIGEPETADEVDAMVSYFRR
jgi:hypothetical protein